MKKKILFVLGAIAFMFMLCCTFEVHAETNSNTTPITNTTATIPTQEETQPTNSVSTKIPTENDTEITPIGEPLGIYTIVDGKNTATVTLYENIAQIDNVIYEGESVEGTALLEYELKENSLILKIQDEGYIFSVEDGNVLKLAPNDVVEDNKEDDDYSFSQQFEVFINKWSQMFINALAGIIGSSSVIFLGWKIIKEFKKTGNDNNANLKKAENLYQNSKKELDSQIEDIKNLIPQLKDDFVCVINQYKEETTLLRETVNTLADNFKKASKLIAILISQNPDLANSGIATEILNILSQKEVNTNEQD